MIKALLKKQMMEVFSFLFVDVKRKKRRTGRALVGFLLLYGVLFAYLGVAFFMMAKPLCEALVPMGLTWFYFMIMGLVALVFGVFGSVFSAYATLYLAKDNDVLLAMPIPPRYILMVRLLGVYLVGLLFELLVLLPAILALVIYGTPTPAGVLFALLLPPVLALLSLSLSCLLGLAVAAISTRIRRKSLVVMLLSLTFLGLYLWGYSKLMSSLTELLAVLGDIAERVKGPLFPFYHMGLAAEGKGLSLLLFTAMVLAVFLVVYLALSRSFLTLATTNRGAAKRTYKRERSVQGSVGKALFVKELKRFLASPVYMLNCGLGAAFLPIAGVMLLVMREDITALLSALTPLVGDAEVLPLLLAAFACMLASMIDITAPSISLEGKSLWILQSLPVPPRAVLYAKLALHLAIGTPALLFAVACMLIALTPSLPFCFLLPLVALLFLLLVGLAGLALNLWRPSFNWTNEAYPVKQSMSVSLTLFGSWGVVVGLAALYLPLRAHLSPVLYLSLVCVLLAAVNAALLAWLARRGARIFADL